jgi:hypothetical protein
MRPMVRKQLYGICIERPSSHLRRRYPIRWTAPVESIHFLGVLRRQLCLRPTAEFWIPSLKSSAAFVIEDVHAYLQ